MKGPLAIIAAGLAAVACCVAGPAAIIAAITAIGLTGATDGLTATLLVAAAIVIFTVRARPQRRHVTDVAALEPAAQSPATAEATACRCDCSSAASSQPVAGAVFRSGSLRRRHGGQAPRLRVVVVLPQWDR